MQVIHQFDLPAIKRVFEATEFIGMSSYPRYLLPGRCAHGTCNIGLPAQMLPQSVMPDTHKDHSAIEAHFACSLSPNFRQSDLENGLWQFARELKYFGVNLEQVRIWLCRV